MRIVKETDWHAERVRCKAIQLLRYLPTRQNVRRKRLLGRGKVISSMPFNIFEGIGLVLRIRWVSDFAVYFGVGLVILGWSLGLVAVSLGRKFWSWLRKVATKIVDEFEDEGDSDVEENGPEETTRLLS